MTGESSKQSLKLAADVELLEQTAAQLDRELEHGEQQRKTAHQQLLEGIERELWENLRAHVPDFCEKVLLPIAKLRALSPHQTSDVTQESDHQGIFLGLFPGGYKIGFGVDLIGR